MAASWQFVTPEIGLQGITVTDTTQNHPLGKRVRARDIQTTSPQGEGEFIYLKGVASTAVGDVVIYDENFATTRGVAGAKGPIAIAMSANVANQYGWYQIAGIAVVTAGTIAADAKMQLISTAKVDDTATAGQDILNAVSQSADGTPAAGQALVAINYPTTIGTGV